MTISFREVAVADARMILDWRTSPRIAQVGITDVPYDIDAQKQWIMDSYNRKDYYHWVIICNNISIGCISIQDFDFENERTSWGFYKGVDMFPGVGSTVVPFLYNWLFFQVGIKNIFTNVFYNNSKAIDLYLHYGHKFMPDKDRVVIKNGCEILIVALSLAVQNWDKGKYKESVAQFPTSLWKYSPI